MPVLLLIGSFKKCHISLSDNRYSCATSGGVFERHTDEVCHSLIVLYTIPMLDCRSAKEGPTIHAFAHSLATTLTYLREEFAKLPPIQEAGVEKTALCALWMQYNIYEEILVALSDLYGRVSIPFIISTSVLNHFQSERGTLTWRLPEI